LYKSHTPGFITPAIKYPEVVIPAKAGIQVGTGSRVNMIDRI